MRGARSVAVVLLLAAGFTWGILRLLHTQFVAGDFYPEYSSLRSDPKGAKLLFDSLSRMPGLSVSRNYMPLDYFPGTAAVLLLGVSPVSLDKDFLQRAEDLAGRGNRVVTAMMFESGDLPKDQSPIEKAWHVRLVVDPKPKHGHRLSFSAPAEWLVRERDGSQILAIERAFDKGSVLLLAESGDFSNESVIGSDRLERVSAAIGPYTRVAFDESHFGIAESGSVVGLVRRFRLVGLALGLVMVGALALWKNASAFPPRGDTGRNAGATGQQYTGRTSFEGLVALLRRHVRPKDVVPICWEEWWKANRREVPAESAARAAAIAAGASQHPLEAMREIQAGLRAKGEL